MNEKSFLAIQQENLELRRENEGLKETLVKCLEQINLLSGVEKRPTDLVVTGQVTRMSRPPELEIVDEQIKRLDAISRERAFSLEEIRALDLLIKNKALLDPNKPIEPDYTKVPEGKTEEDLLRIAENVTTEPETSRKGKSRAKTSS